MKVEFTRPEIECEKSDAYTPRSEDKAVHPSGKQQSERPEYCQEGLHSSLTCVDGVSMHRKGQQFKDTAQKASRVHSLRHAAQLHS